MLTNLNKKIKLLALNTKMKILGAYYWRRFNGDLRYDVHMFPLVFKKTALEAEFDISRLIKIAQDTSSNGRLSEVFAKLK